jgi:hypothetical protein
MTNPAVPLVFLDTETDDLDPRKRQPWDVALIRREPDGTETEHQFFVQLDLSIADSFALKVGHFWDRHPQGRYYAGLTRTTPMPTDNGDPRSVRANDVGDYLTRRAAAQRIALLTHGAHIVGAIPSFDTITLEPLLWAHQLIPMWHYHIVDVEALTVGWIAGVAARANDEARMRDEEAPVSNWAKLTPPWKSEDLSRALGVDLPSEEERHTALGDARWAMRIYDTVMGVARDENGRVAA